MAFELIDIDVTTLNSSIGTVMAAAREKYASLRRTAPKSQHTASTKTGTEDFDHRYAVIICSTERLIAQGEAQLAAPIHASFTRTPAERLEEADEEEWSVGHRKVNRLSNRMATENWKFLSDTAKVIREREESRSSTPKSLQRSRSASTPATGWSSYVPEDVRVWLLKSNQPWEEYNTDCASDKPPEAVRDSGRTSSDAGTFLGLFYRLW